MSSFEPQKLKELQDFLGALRYIHKRSQRDANRHFRNLSGFQGSLRESQGLLENLRDN